MDRILGRHRGRDWAAGDAVNSGRPLGATMLRIDVGSPRPVAAEAALRPSAGTCGLLAFCPHLRALAWGTGDGVQMAVVSPPVNGIVTGSAVEVPLRAAASSAGGLGFDLGSVCALQWCTAGMSMGAAVLVAMSSGGAACGVVRLSMSSEGDGEGVRLVLEGVKAVAVDLPGGNGGALRQMQASAVHPVVAFVSSSSLAVAGLPGGDLLARLDVPVSSGNLTACQWLDAAAWGEPGGAVLALGFRAEIWFVAWTNAQVDASRCREGGPTTWGEPRVMRRVLPGAQGPLRSLAAAGRWLFASSDQKVELPKVSGPINFAFADETPASSAALSFGARDAGASSAAVVETNVDEGGMVHIRASTSSARFGSDGATVPRSLILPEVQAAAAATAANYAAGTLHHDSIAGGGVNAHGFAALHAIALRPEGLPPPRTPGRVRSTFGYGVDAVDEFTDQDAVEMCSVSLPASIGRPDVLFVNDAADPETTSPVVIVGSTVAAPAFAAVALIERARGQSDEEIAAADAALSVIGCEPIGDALGAMTDRPVRIKAVAQWPHRRGGGGGGGWVLTAQPANAAARGGASSFTTTLNGPFVLALSPFSVSVAAAPGSGSASERRVRPGARGPATSRADTSPLRGKRAERGEDPPLPLFGRLAREGLSNTPQRRPTVGEGTSPAFTPTPGPKPLSASALAALAAAGATPGSSLGAPEAAKCLRVSSSETPSSPGAQSFTWESKEGKKRGTRTRGKRRSRSTGQEQKTTAARLPREHDRDSSERSCDASGGGSPADAALDALAMALSSRLGVVPKAEREAEDGSREAHARGVRDVGGSNLGGPGGAGEVGIATVVEAIQGLGRMLDARMDRIEAAMQSHERRLRKIEAAVTPPM